MCVKLMVKQMLEGNYGVLLFGNDDINDFLNRIHETCGIQDEGLQYKILSLAMRISEHKLN